MITNDGNSHELGVVDKRTIYDQIESINVINDDKVIYQHVLKKGEKPITKKRTNMKLGQIFIVGYHKGGKQELVFIEPDGRIISHEQRNKDELGNYHAFHSDVELGEHEK